MVGPHSVTNYKHVAWDITWFGILKKKTKQNKTEKKQKKTKTKTNFSNLFSDIDQVIGKFAPTHEIGGFNHRPRPSARYFQSRNWTFVCIPLERREVSLWLKFIIVKDNLLCTFTSKCFIIIYVYIYICIYFSKFALLKFFNCNIEIKKILKASIIL